MTRIVLCYKNDWATMLHLCYTCYLLPVTNYFATKLSIIDNFSACKEYLAENRLPFPSAPCWVTLTYQKDYDCVGKHSMQFQNLFYAHARSI